MHQILSSEISAFTDHLKFEKRYSFHTVRSYHDDLIQFRDYIITSFGSMSVEEISSAVVRSWLASLKDEDLKSLFSEFGEVISSKVINDKETGQSKGFGFVEMRDDNQALQAIKRLSNAEHFGKHLVVSRARPKVSDY